MLNNYFLKEYLRNCRNRRCFNTQQSRFVTPCEALNKYIKDPCSMFIENIIPVPGPVPPIPPMPPFPPMPPRPRLDFIILQGGGVLNSPAAYPLVPVELVGNAIQYNPAGFSVDLAANRRYLFTWRTITEVNAMPFLIFNSLDRVNGNEWDDSRAEATMTTRPGIVELAKTGILSTGNSPENAQLVFFSSIGALPTSAILEIELLP